MDVQVKLAETAQERLSVFALRYAITVAEQGKSPPGADNDTRLFTDEHDETAAIFLAQADGEVVASLTLLYPAERFDPDWTQQFGIDPSNAGQCVVVCRLVVRPDWRASGILGRLFGLAYDHARLAGHALSYCLAAPALVKLYEKLGYRCFRASSYLPHIGLRVPMLMVINDLAYLETVVSPFLRQWRKKDTGQRNESWFGQHFPDYHAYYQDCAQQEQYWSDIAHRVELRGETLFRDLHESDIRAFIDSSTVLHLSAGQKLIQTGDVDQEMYYVLSGTVEVLKTVGTSQLSLAAFGPGQIVGELAFLSRKSRTADVVAIEDAQVLSISRSSLERLALKMPMVTVKVVMNLAETLGERLQHTTQKFSLPFQA